LITGQGYATSCGGSCEPDQRRIDLAVLAFPVAHHTEDVVLKLCEHVGENAHGAQAEAGAATEAAEEPMAMSVPPH